MTIICRIAQLISDLRGPNEPLPGFIRRHTSGCPHCQAEAAARADISSRLQGYSGSVRASGPTWERLREALEREPVSGAPRFRARKLALAGSVALVLAVSAAAVGIWSIDHGARRIPAPDRPARVVTVPPEPQRKAPPPEAPSAPSIRQNPSQPPSQSPSMKPAPKPPVPKRRIILPPRKKYYAVRPEDKDSARMVKHEPKEQMPPAHDQPVVALVVPEEHVIEVVGADTDTADEAGYVIEQVSVADIEGADAVRL